MNMITRITAQSRSPDHRIWADALARHRAAEAEYDELCDRAEAAEAAAAAAGPGRVDRYFDDYKLSMGIRRDNAEWLLRQYVHETGDEIDIRATADEFMAYQRDDQERRSLFRVDEAEATRRQFYGTFYRARDELMEVPAPDLAALLVKMEIVATSLVCDHAESTLADARRLLANAEHGV